MGAVKQESVSLDQVRAWLEEHRESSMRWGLGEAVFSSVAGVLVTSFTFVFVHAALWWVLCVYISLPGEVATVLSLLYLPLSFVGHACRNSDRLGPRLHLLRSLFCWGPLLLHEAVLAIRKRRRARELDVERCAAVLHHVVSRESRVSFASLRREFPHSGLGETLFQLKNVEGVLFLKKDSPSVALTEVLRKKLEGDYVPEARLRSDPFLELSPGKVAALGLTVVGVIVGVHRLGTFALVGVWIVVFANAFILFPEAIGDLKVFFPLGWSGHRITRSTPGCLVSAIGWVGLIAWTMRAFFAEPPCCLTSEPPAPSRPTSVEPRLWPVPTSIEDIDEPLSRQTPTPDDLSHGQCQIQRMLKDRPGMRGGSGLPDMTEDDIIWQWVAHGFAGRHCGFRVYWDPEPPTYDAPASHRQVHGKGYVRIRNRDVHDRSGRERWQAFDTMWSGVVFELYNLANTEGFKWTHWEALAGRLDREEYAERAARLEYDAVTYSARFYEYAWRPWAVERGHSPDAHVWHYPAPTSYEKWFRQFTDPSGYPWDPYSEYFDAKVVPHLERRRLRDHQETTAAGE